MKIAISGPANSGKSTLLKRFINNWPMYVTPAETYRDALKEKNLSHSKSTSEETQKVILDYMVKQLDEYKDVENIIYDRCPLDVLVYTMQAFQNGLVSEDFVTDTVLKVKESLSAFDIIFVLHYDENIPIEDNGTRETDVEYIKETERIFANILHEYYTDFDSHDIFPENCPGIIELEGDNKMIDIKALINAEGKLYSPEDDQKLQQSFTEALAYEKKKKELMNALISGQEQLLPKVDVSNLKI